MRAWLSRSARRKSASRRRRISTTRTRVCAVSEAVAAAAPVTIELTRAGITQSWYGVVDKISPAMGFRNIITSDFHLHLRAGTISGWRASDADGQLALRALDLAGAETGLDAARSARRAPSFRIKS